MANRHKAFKKGGGVGKADTAFGNKDVIAEAKKRKSGGEVGKVLGKAAGGRLDRKSGGSVMSSAGGGSADKSPFACAAKGPR